MKDVRRQQDQGLTLTPGRLPGHTVGAWRWLSDDILAGLGWIDVRRRRGIGRRSAWPYVVRAVEDVVGVEVVGVR